MNAEVQYLLFEMILISYTCSFIVIKRIKFNKPYFIILNYLKIPIFAWEGRINWASFATDVTVFPLVAVGAFIGIIALEKIPQKWFNIIIQILAVLASLRLIVNFC